MSRHPFLIADVFTDRPFSGNQLGVRPGGGRADDGTDAGDGRGARTSPRPPSCCLPGILTEDSARAHLHAQERASVRRPPDRRDRSGAGLARAAAGGLRAGDARPGSRAGRGGSALPGRPGRLGGLSSAGHRRGRAARRSWAVCRSARPGGGRDRARPGPAVRGAGRRGLRDGSVDQPGRARPRAGPGPRASSTRWHRTACTCSPATRASPETDLRARMFAPAQGIPEDPATGSAAASLAALLGARAADGVHRWRIVQGVEMGRPSRIEAMARVEAGKVAEVRIAGAAVLVAEGTITAPPA